MCPYYTPPRCVRKRIDHLTIGGRTTAFVPSRQRRARRQARPERPQIQASAIEASQIATIPNVAQKKNDALSR